MSNADFEILEPGRRYRIPVCRVSTGGKLTATGQSVELALVKGSHNASDCIPAQDGITLESLLKLLILDLEHKSTLVDSEEGPRMLYHLRSALDGMRARAYRRAEQSVFGTYQK